MLVSEKYMVLESKTSGKKNPTNLVENLKKIIVFYTLMQKTVIIWF